MQAEAKVLNFMGWRKTAASISMILLLVSVVSLFVRGLELGLDFTGGSQVELGFSEPADLSVIRVELRELGLENPVAVYFGSESEVLIRTQSPMQEGATRLIERQLNQVAPEASLVGVNKAPSDLQGFTDIVIFDGVSEEQLRQAGIFSADYYGKTQFSTQNQQLQVAVEQSLDNAFTQYLMGRLAQVSGAQVDLRRSEFIGPQIGEELRDEGGLGLLFALAVVMMFVAIRFQYKFSIGAVTALIHDVIIVLGAFSILGLDFDLTVLAAILAVIGYSLNDTIVVFDRIRENFRKMRRATTIEVINISLTQTLERTLITSLTTLLVLVVLFLFGGELINGFASALIIGVVVGTYSSIYVSANTLAAMHLTKEDLMPPEKEGEEQEELVP